MDYSTKSIWSFLNDEFNNNSNYHLLSVYYATLMETGMPTHSSILACRIPWTEEHVRLPSIGSQKDTTEAT